MRVLKWTAGPGLLCCLFAASIACQGDTAVERNSPVAAKPTVSVDITSSPSPVVSIGSTTVPAEPARVPITAATSTPTVPVPDSSSNPCGGTFFPARHQREFLDWSPDGSLLFDFDQKIWVIRSDGSLVELVDPDPRDDRSSWGFHADFSPEGDQVVYSTCSYPTEDGMEAASNPTDSRHEGYEIATINVDGTGQQRRTVNNSLNHYPAWSPDGKTIVFVRSHGQTPDYNVDGATLGVLSDEDGEMVVRAMMGGIFRVALYPPVWSPDGQRLVVGVAPPGPRWSDDPRIWWTMNADGTERQKVGESFILPSWSPDGERLAFVEFYGDKGLEATIYTVRYDGTDLREIWESGPPGANSYPITSIAWSPDGSEILAVSGWLWAVNLESGDTRVVGPQNPPFWLEDAIWSPDGSRIAARSSKYSRVDSGPLGIVVLSVDGSALRILVAEEKRGVLEEWDTGGKGP